MRIVERAPNTFVLYWDLGRDTSGRRHQKTETFKGSCQDAERRWREVQADIEQRKIGAPSTGSVADVAAQYVAERSLIWRSKTLALNSMLLGEHILPVLGSVQIKKLRRSDCHRVVSELVSLGKAPRADQVRSLLSAVCDYAVEIGLISANPAEDPRHPVGSKKEIAGWTDAEAHRFLAAAFGHRLYPLYVLALATGMRMGELLALSWTDVDLEGCIITVSRTALSTGRATASRRGVRRIGIGPVAVRMLEGHRSRLASERGVLGEQESDLVFPSVAGTPIRHQNLVRNFALLVRVAAVTPIAIDRLRNTSARHLLTAGVDPRVVSERLGHQAPRLFFTLPIDADALLTMQKEAAQRGDDFFFPPKG